MKECSQCKRVYADESLNFCLDDGTSLKPADGEPTTVLLAQAAVKAGDHPDIKFCTTEDGARIAYAVTGSGPLLVRVLGHFTHLEMEWEWPELRHLWERLAQRFTVVRYDGRGIGLSTRYAGEFTEVTRQLDLKAVLDAIGNEPAILLGISEGGWTSAEFANEQPGRVSHLVLYGSYARGAQARPGYDREEDEALETLIRKGWGRDTPAFRQFFTSVFFKPDADPRLISHFNDMQRASADPDTAVRYHRSLHRRGDGTEIFRRVNVPALVIHCKADMAVNPDEGRLLASLIPEARLVILPSGTHYFPTDREVVNKVATAIDRFIERE